MNPLAGTIVTAVAFGQDQIQISFIEQRHQTAKAALDQTLVLEMSDKDRQLVNEIQEALVEIIDNYWVGLRHPEPEPDPPTNRFLRGDDRDEE